MTGHESRWWRMRTAGLIAGWVLVASACGGGDDSSSETAADEPAAAPAEEPQTAESTETSAPETTESTTTTTTATTTTTTTTTTTEPPGAWDPYQDGENDCQRTADYAAAPMCMPPDIESVSITRASPLTIVTVFRGPAAETGWQLTIGFDLDNDPSTGIVDGIWSELHGIGPDLEFDYFPDVNGAPFAQSYRIDPGPEFIPVEAGPPEQGPLNVWTWLDDVTLQLVISDELVADDVSGFEVAGQTLHPDYHDAFPDTGPLTWPE